MIITDGRSLASDRSIAELNDFVTHALRQKVTNSKNSNFAISGVLLAKAKSLGAVLLTPQAFSKRIAKK